ncbi:glycerol-3-phosphate acyltransferase PlsY [Anaerosolibacter carboniphilus]|uniref:Glycerol-3-phosphate acyltransferase n=1 Tax=Anaerosolibacter carboniphilus TaxID=1417629 RepID=A0A841L1D2_9FIRM|nr:glycerol-3-phosphate 1-O-acyltransferase PlsY [Anaerosolibacter carboniphilus]MBB6216982.1 glycerol-3-phosphate acyltransferase PlsY [Anaerosolibacter carboniphilus]
MLLKVLAVLLSYVIGNFSTSIIVSKLWAGIDIRKYGSGNAGATNVLRTLGMKAGLVTFIGDALKAILAVWIGRRLGGEGTALICGIAVVIGHNWPAFLGFKGGKGIASSIGVGLSVNPIIAIICIIVGILIIAKTKYVSLGSVVAICLLPILLLFVGFKFFLFGLALALMAIYRHKENISRLLKGTESKLGQKSRIK